MRGGRERGVGTINPLVITSHNPEPRRQGSAHTNFVNKQQRHGPTLKKSSGSQNGFRSHSFWVSVRHSNLFHLPCRVRSGVGFATRSPTVEHPHTRGRMIGGLSQWDEGFTLGRRLPRRTHAQRDTALLMTPCLQTVAPVRPSPVRSAALRNRDRGATLCCLHFSRGPETKTGEVG